ncbi:hypothetical protein [Streptomyces gibsoniae]|uniref:Uncharacterized protein n=1 Tax=Streptomyces gibsoniae TaxID=3075529 RepID=A0ABU2U2S4_9ACTN|nr:hypothetical protein [Streptomyces sp. DSM 41699]MDT0467523.1 hypothetical protein [Streptomyces sp. DSM 41699]
MHARILERLDFSQVRDEIGDRGLATRADAPATGESDVRYAKLIPMNDPEQEIEQAGGFIVATGARIITLQWRPNDSYWRVHAFGDYLRPEDLPPTR